MMTLLYLKQIFIIALYHIRRTLKIPNYMKGLMYA